MKRFSWLIGLLLVCSTQVSYAKDCGPCATPVEECDFCDFDFCDVCYNVYVDALYWQVRAHDTGHGCPDWEWGFRLAGYAHYKNWDLGIRWTSFDNDSRIDNEFDVVDIEFGYTFHWDCDHATFRPFAGAKLAWVDHSYNDEHLDHQGYGLTIGADFRWTLCAFSACDNQIPVSFLSRASASILSSEFGHHCDYVDVQELFVGLEFAFCDLFCDIDATFAVGYEVQSWNAWRSLDESHDLGHFGIGGLVLRFGANF